MLSVNGYYNALVSLVADTKLLRKCLLLFLIYLYLKLETKRKEYSLRNTTIVSAQQIKLLVKCLFLLLIHKVRNEERRILT